MLFCNAAVPSFLWGNDASRSDEQQLLVLLGEVTNDMSIPRRNQRTGAHEAVVHPLNLGIGGHCYDAKAQHEGCNSFTSMEAFSCLTCAYMTLRHLG